MVTIDYLLLAAVGVSALVGLFRGFVKEALSLGVWIAAAWCAVRFGDEVSVLLDGFLEDPVLLLWAGRLLAFVIVLFAGSLLGWLAGYFIRHSVITGTDRALGMIFGVGRGLVVAGLLVLGLQLGGFTAEPWWRESKLIPYAAAIGETLRQVTRDQLAERTGNRLQPGSLRSDPLQPMVRQVV